MRVRFRIGWALHMAETECGWTDNHGHLSAKHLVYFGPTLKVDIGFDPTYTPDSGRLAKVSVTGVDALLDTGASESCIDTDLATQLNLPVVGHQTLRGAHGAKKVKVHLAHIVVPSLEIVIHGKFAGVDLIAGGQRHHALIGRTFLQRLTMVYDGATGKVTLRS